jgi:hypothetical protein
MKIWILVFHGGSIIREEGGPKQTWCAPVAMLVVAINCG